MEVNKLTFLLIFSFILTVSCVSAQSTDCTIYGCKVNPSSSTNVIINQTTTNVNDSNYLDGYTPATLPLSDDAETAFNNAYSFINSVVNGNLTAAKEYANEILSGNLTGYYTKAEVNSIVLGNLTNFVNSSNASTTYVPYTGASNNVNLGSNNLTTTGNVRIGTTAPMAKLTIAGTTDAAIYLNNSGNFAATFDVNANKVDANTGLGGFTGRWNGNRVTGFIFKTGDDNTNKDEGYISLYTRNTGESDWSEKATLSKEGYLGIGTTSPINTLDVNGTGRFTSTATPTLLTLNTESSAHSPTLYLRNLNGQRGYIMFPAGAGSFGIKSSNGTEYLTIPASGFVGIGTATPDTKLTVSTVDSAGLSIKTTGTDSQARLALTNDVRSFQFRVDGTTADTFIIRDSTAGADRLAITSAGRVGIGTNSPTVKLHVSDGVTLNSNFTNALGSTDLAITRSGDIAANTIVVTGNDVTDRGVNYLIRARGTLTTPLAVQENDNVGDFLFGAFNGASVQNSAGLFAFVDGSVTSSSMPIRLSFVTGTTSGNRQERLTIKNDGNVGIGTTSPSYPLHVGTNVSGISAYFAGNISVDDVIFRSKVYDKSKGSALAYIKDASTYLNQDGTINHSAFEYSKVKWNEKYVSGYNNETKVENVCTGEGNETVCEDKEIVSSVPIYSDRIVEGYSAESEIATMRQALYELNQKVIYLESELNKVKIK